MSVQLGHSTYDDGGMCYVACQEAFEWYNSSMFWCQKGCDYSKGRKLSDDGVKEAHRMCKQVAAQSYALREYDLLDNIEDMRIHATMYSNNAQNLYKACAAGIRRQRY